MIFLIEYNRREGRLLNLRVFPNSEQSTAEQERLEKEISLLRNGTDHEVVLLEASSEEALRKTHRRYFETPEQIMESVFLKVP